jgi:hypothetical protein
MPASRGSRAPLLANAQRLPSQLGCLLANPFGVGLLLPPRSLLRYPTMPRCCRFFVFPRREEGAYPQRSVIDEQRRKGEKAGATQRAIPLWAVWLRCSFFTCRCGHARRSRLAIQPKPFSRGAAGYFNRLLDPGDRDVASPPRLNVDFIINPALFVETLQVRQQGRPRELHRFGCWSRRSSHGQDHIGSQPCTLAPRPAPKSTATLSDIELSVLLFFLRKSRGEVLKKIITASEIEMLTLFSRQALGVRARPRTAFGACRFD